MSGTPHLHRRAAAAGGFTLVEMALVLLIVGLLAAVFLPATNTLLDNNRRKETRAKLEALEQAMVRFVMVNRRLPCPADGTLGTGNAQSGVEQRNPAEECTAMASGVVPWRSLGLSADAATDAWNSLITYRVWAKTNTGNGSGITTSLAATGAMDMSVCDPAGTLVPAAPQFNCITNAGPPPTYSAPQEFLIATSQPIQARGFRACQNTNCNATLLTALPGQNELARRVDGNGAAYFLISHGASTVHAYRPTGGLVLPDPGLPGPGPREDINANGQPMTDVSNLNSAFYIDADITENRNDPDYYDDIVSRPTVMSVVMAAGLGPRKH